MPAKKPQGSLAERTQAASAFFKAIDELNDAAKVCAEAGLRVHCNYIEDRCSPCARYRGSIETDASGVVY